MLTVINVDELRRWSKQKTIVHFVGISGAGKTQLISRLAQRCRRHRGDAYSTIDVEPWIDDESRHADRAYSRVYDRLHNKYPSSVTEETILKHALSSVEKWNQSKSNLILLDRWYESYDNLSQETKEAIEEAFLNVDCSILRVFLFRGADSVLTERESVELCMKQKFSPRHAASCSFIPPDSLINEEMEYQQAYRSFCLSSRVPFFVVNTTEHEWSAYEDYLASIILQQ